MESRFNTSVAVIAIVDINLLVKMSIVDINLLVKMSLWLIQYLTPSI